MSLNFKFHGVDHKFTDHPDDAGAMRDEARSWYWFYVENDVDPMPAVTMVANRLGLSEHEVDELIKEE